MSHTDVSLKMNSKLNYDRTDRWSEFWCHKTLHFNQNRPAGLLNRQWLWCIVGNVGTRREERCVEWKICWLMMEEPAFKIGLYILFWGELQIIFLTPLASCLTSYLYWTRLPIRTVCTSYSCFTDRLSQSLMCGVPTGVNVRSNPLFCIAVIPGSIVTCWVYVYWIVYALVGWLVGWLVGLSERNVQTVSTKEETRGASAQNWPH